MTALAWRLHSSRLELLGLATATSRVFQRIREAAALVRGTQTGFISWSVTPAKGSTLRLPEQVEVLASLFAVVAQGPSGPVLARAERGT
jgi:hypothetical protein